LRELNLSVPQDVSVVGFNNAMISQVSNPTITTVDIGTYQLGFTSVFTLLRMLRGETSIDNRVIIPHRIILRESSGSI
jgi:DNA-binding LacI/PurR family transcriptional regulator